MTKRKSTFLLILLFFLFCFSLISCTEQIKKNTDDDSPVGVVDFVSGSGSNNASFAEIEGSWNGPCEKSAVEYVQRDFNFSNGSLKLENQFYPDVNCMDITKTPVVFQGVYEIGDDFTTSTGLLAKEIDMTVIESNASELRFLDIVYIDINGNLYFGTKNDMGERPVTLDLGSAYTR